MATGNRCRQSFQISKRPRKSQTVFLPPAPPGLHRRHRSEHSHPFAGRDHRLGSRARSARPRRQPRPLRSDHAAGTNGSLHIAAARRINLTRRSRRPSVAAPHHRTLCRNVLHRFATQPRARLAYGPRGRRIQSPAPRDVARPPPSPPPPSPPPPPTPPPPPPPP